MSLGTAAFLEGISQWLERAMRQVPDYCEGVVNEYNYAYFSHFGKRDVMNYSTAVFLINDKARALNVIYEPEKELHQQRRYMVKTLDPDISVGDFVVVPSTARHKMDVAKVVDVDVEVDFDSTTEVFWVISAIDFNNFNTLIEQEKAAVEKIKAAHVLDTKKKLAQSLMAAKDFKKIPQITGSK